MEGPRRLLWLDWAVVVGLYALSFALRWPLRHVLPYGDEGQHYYMARHWLHAPTDLTDVEGGTWFHQSWIVWQRPVFYVALHLFAIHGFVWFRIGQILATSFLPVALWAACRAYGGHRFTALAVGAAGAGLPALVTWGGLGFMDEWMAFLLLFALAARRLGHHVLGGFLFLLAIWAKETAWAAVAGVAGVSFLAAWVRGEATLWPFQLDKPTTPLVAALALGPIPIIISLMTGLNQTGAHAQGYGVWLMDMMYATPWFLPVLLVGLRWRASRPLCALALFWTTGYLLSHVVGGRSVEGWYMAATIAFTLVGVAMTLDQAVRNATRWGPRIAANAAAAGSIALVLVIVVVPAGAAKGHWIHPLKGQTEDSWAGTIRYQSEIRDRALGDALAIMRLDGSQDILTEDMYPPSLALTTQAHHVWIDSAAIRERFPIITDAFVQRLETNGTWLLVHPVGLSFSNAIDETYADCRVLDTPEYKLYAAWRCPGRGEALQADYLAHRHEM